MPALPLEHQHIIRTVNSIRVLWLSPWMRPLARVQAEALRRRFLCAAATSSQHPAIGCGSPPRFAPLPPGRLPSRPGAGSRIGPDVVIAEGRPRSSVLDRVGRLGATYSASLRTTSTNGGRPTSAPGSTAGVPGCRKATVTYSDSCRGRRRHSARRGRHPRDASAALLHLDPALVPPLVGPEGRHDFVMIGRVKRDKNVDVVLEAPATCCRRRLAR